MTCSPIHFLCCSIYHGVKNNVIKERLGNASISGPVHSDGLVHIDLVMFAPTAPLMLVPVKGFFFSELQRIKQKTVVNQNISRHRVTATLPSHFARSSRKEIIANYNGLAIIEYVQNSPTNFKNKSTKNWKNRKCAGLGGKPRFFVWFVCLCLSAFRHEIFGSIFRGEMKRRGQYKLGL